MSLSCSSPPFFSVSLGGPRPWLWLVVFAAALVLGLTGPPPALGQPELEVRVSEYLTEVGQGLDLHVKGTVGGPWQGARARVELTGPARPSAGVDGRPVAGSLDVDLGDLSAGFDQSVSIPAELLPAPGAYRLTVTVTAAGDKSMTAAAWLGRVSPAPPSSELAAVWPLALGIQRDPEGVFVSRAIQDSVLPDARAAGSLYAFFSLVDRHPEWHLTLAVEPLLLTQMRDLADGFRERVDGQDQDVAGNDRTAGLAEQALVTFRQVAALDSVQVIPAPYATPHLPVLAREGWPDGLAQMQLGKSELQKDLELIKVPDGAYPPGLEITTDSLGFLSGASIDFALAAPEVREDLAEVPEDQEGPVRVRDADGNRITLLFVNKELRAATGPPWDAGLFFAALASELAGGKRGPFIVSPAQDYLPAPGHFLEEVAQTLQRNPWLHTRTLTEVLASHPPSRRPIFLTRYGGYVEGFVGQAFAERLRGARALVQDLLSATDSDRAPRDRLLLLLYQAQSRYWFLGGSDPRVANLGLAYLEAAEALVKEEFDKVDVAGDKSVIILGDDGEVPVAIVNRTGYPLEVDVHVEGKGLSIGGEAARRVTLGPQENILSFPVGVKGASGSVHVRVVAGITQLEDEFISVRAVSVRALLPWGLGLFVVFVVVAGLLVRRRSGA